MCYFLTIGVPGPAAELFEEAVPRNMHACRVENRSVLRGMKPGFVTYLLTHGGCSCGLFYPDSEPTAVWPSELTGDDSMPSRFSALTVT